MGLPPGPSIAPSVAVDLDDGLGEGLGCLLGQVVSDTTLDDPMRVFVYEFIGVGVAVRVWGAVGVTFQGDGGHGDDRTGGQPLFQLVKFRLARGQAEAPAVVVDDDADMIRVVQRCRAAIEGGVVEVPLRGRELPDEPGKLMSVPVVAD